VIKTDKDMKRIVIVDGVPRCKMNTAQLLQRFAEGTQSVGKDIEVKTCAYMTLTIRVVCCVWLAN